MRNDDRIEIPADLDKQAITTFNIVFMDRPRVRLGCIRSLRLYRIQQPKHFWRKESPQVVDVRSG
jgi:hypothetical protein